jgi:hypothetical protein
MYEHDEVLELPGKDATIWRFMPLPGLLSLLQRKQLFFGALARMQDPYECAVPDSAVNAYAQWSGMSADYRKHTPQDDALLSVVRNMACINCWHANPVESAAMWKLYSEHHGIAIRSTVGRLIDAFSLEPQPIQIGKVYYVDFSALQPEDRDCCFRQSFVKRKSFEHEREIRAVMDNFGILPSRGAKPNFGTYANVDVSVLVDRIYVSPHVEHWLHEVVKREVLLHGFPEIPIQQSDLYSQTLG